MRLNNPAWVADLRVRSTQESHSELPVFLLCFCSRCKVCPLTFFSKSDMQIHSKTHTEAKAHKCPHCTKSFANASYLAQHLRIHLGIKPYRCSYCEKCFRQLSHLQQHTRSELCSHHSVHFKALSQPLRNAFSLSFIQLRLTIFKTSKK